MIRIVDAPCRDYLDWVAGNGAFLDSPAWSDVLAAGLSARSRFLWDSEAGLGHLLAIFRRGPFSIGYLGFPLCSDPRAHAGPYSLDKMVHAIIQGKDRPDLLRIPLSPFGARALTAGSHTTTATVETCITDLAAWSATATAQRRRYLSVANKQCTELTPTSRLDPREMHQLYQSAVHRNRGTVRYGHGYFKALAALDEHVLSIQALKREDVPISMALTVSHGDYTCYLHGGTAASSMGMGASDLLMARSISSAQSAGSRCYNFLPSPVHQRGLSKFKEKWGGESRPSATMQIAIGHKGKFLTGLLAALQSARTLHTKATSA